MQIKNRYDDAVIFEEGIKSIKELVELAVDKGVNLQEANLREVDLREADLREADLWGANLQDADLRGVDLLARISNI